ncbi:MAG: hypothetical protein AAFY88_11825, partial [Acidobacteriota bacterium]
ELRTRILEFKAQALNVDVAKPDEGGRRAGGRGDIEAGRRHYDQAADAFRAAIASAPSSPPAFVGLCHVYVQRLRLEFQNPSPELDALLPEAMAACSTAIEIDGDLPEARISYAQLLRSWARYLSWSGKDPLEGFGEALRQARRAVELAPDLAEAHSAYASVLTQRAEFRMATRSGDPREDLTEAADVLEKALELQPRDGHFLNLLGGAWRIRGTYEARNGHDFEEASRRAVEYYILGVEAAPKLFARHHNLANAYLLQCHGLFRRGEEYGPCLDAMERSYRTAIELNPEADWSHVSLGASVAMQADRQLLLGGEPDALIAEAFDWTDRAIELNPGVAEFYFWRSSHQHRKAYYALLRGEDLAPMIEASRNHIREGASRAPDRVDIAARRLEASVLELRAAMRDGESLRAALGRGDRTLEELLVGDAKDSFYFNSSVTYLLWSAAAEVDRGRRPVGRLTRGLELAEEAIEKGVATEDHIGYRGILLFLQSQLSGPQRERRRQLEAAEADLSEALRRNRWLSLELDPWLAKVRKALESGPRFEDDVS